MNRFNSVILSQVRFCFQTADCRDSPYFFRNWRHIWQYLIRYCKWRFIFSHKNTSRISVILHTILHTFLRTCFFDYINMAAKMSNKSTFLLIKFRLYPHFFCISYSSLFVLAEIMRMSNPQAIFSWSKSFRMAFPRLLFRVNSVYFNAVRIPIALS